MRSSATYELRPMVTLTVTDVSQTPCIECIMTWFLFGDGGIPLCRHAPVYWKPDELTARERWQILDKTDRPHVGSLEPLEPGAPAYHRDEIVLYWPSLRHSVITLSNPTERTDMKDGTYMGNYFHTQLKGQTVRVLVVELEQNFNSRHHGKWVCLNEATGRRLHRTRRQLHPIVEAS